MALQQRSFAAFAAVAALLALSIAVLSAHARPVAHSGAGGSGARHVKSEAAAGWSRIAAVDLASHSLVPADQNSLDRRAVEFDFASNAFISVIFAIKQRNTDALASKLKAVSDPASEDYGKYMTVEEMAKFVDGEPDAVNNVVTSLILRNVAYRMPAANNYVIVDKMPLAVASELFMCNFHLFESEKGNRIIKTLEYTLDSDIADAVDFVLGLDNFPSTSARKTVISSARRAATSDDAPLTVSPSSINIAYNLSNYMATNPATTQAVASFLSQYFTPSDLSTFQSRYSVPLNPIRQIVGGNDPSNPGMEATLDVEYITATGRNVTTWFVFESSLVNEGQEDFLKYLIGQLNTTNTPLVHSISYGDIADTIPEDYKARVSIEFQKFGVIGRTIAIAAGDNGVRCENNVFSPEWPTSDPNVLSIGGTIASGNTEHVWADGGGGFSNTFARPSYQSDAVAKYLSSGVAPATSFFNSSSRAYPDIAAFAMGFEVFFDGAPATVGGTSAATPTWAGILSLLNDVRLNKGLPSLGFFNPLLYQLATQHPEAFHDITVGSNPFGSCPGFQATTGWDPASGWGTPNFGVLAALLSTK